MRSWEGQVHHNQLEPYRGACCTADRLICPSVLVLNLMRQGVKWRSFCVRPNFPFTTTDNLPQSSVTSHCEMTHCSGWLFRDFRVLTGDIQYFREYKTCVPSYAEPSKPSVHPHWCPSVEDLLPFVIKRKHQRGYFCTESHRTERDQQVSTTGRVISSSDPREKSFFN